MFEFFAGYMLGSSGNSDCCNNKQSKSVSYSDGGSGFLGFIGIMVILTTLFYTLTNTMSKAIMNFFGMIDTIKYFEDLSKIEGTQFNLVTDMFWQHRDTILIANLMYIIYIQIKIIKSRNQ